MLGLFALVVLLFVFMTAVDIADHVRQEKALREAQEQEADRARKQGLAAAEYIWLATHGEDYANRAPGGGP